MTAATRGFVVAGLAAVATVWLCLTATPDVRALPQAHALPAARAQRYASPPPRRRRTPVAVASETQSWCDATNPEPSSTRVCLGDAWGLDGEEYVSPQRRKAARDAVHLVVTATEADVAYLMEPRSVGPAPDDLPLWWLRSLPFTATVFVKSPATTSYRSALMASHEARAATNRAGGFMSSAVLAEGVADDMLRYYGVHWNATGTDARLTQRMCDPTQLPFEHEALGRKLKAVGGEGTFCSALRRVLRDWEIEEEMRGVPSGMFATAGRIAVVETPNVGDEALSLTAVLAFAAGGDAWSSGHAALPYSDPARRHKVHRLVTDVRAGVVRAMGAAHGVEQKWLLNLHAHRKAWHALDVVQQLRCTCIDPAVEAYKSLTTPTKAFFTQCVAVGAVDGGSQRAAAAARSGGAASSSAAAERRVSSYRHAMHRRATAASINMRRGFRALFGDRAANGVPTLPPPAMLRDCCSTMLVRPASWNTQRVARLAAHAFVTLVAQPIAPRAAAADPVLRHDRDARGRDALQDVDPGLPVLLEELSMYVERMWRWLLRPTVYDTLRDVGVLGQCGAKRAVRKPTAGRWEQDDVVEALCCEHAGRAECNATTARAVRRDEVLDAAKLLGMADADGAAWLPQQRACPFGSAMNQFAGM